VEALTFRILCFISLRVRAVIPPTHPPAARAFGSSGYEYRISDCGRLEQAANLSAIFHPHRPAALAPFYPFYSSFPEMAVYRTGAGYVARGMLTYARPPPLSQFTR